MAHAAAEQAADIIRESIARNGSSRILAATGASQFEFLEELTSASGIDWSKVEMFHLDEYVGLPESHPASFRKYMRERLIAKTGIANFHLIDGEGDVSAHIAELTREIRKVPIDVAFVGIGENGHLAFNDPPADFDTDESYIVVRLDEACRQQQVNEGWFKSVSEVPERAVSITIREVLRAKRIICVVPDSRKAQAVKNCVEGEISRMFPASILREHNETDIYLDNESAALLSPKERGGSVLS